MKTETSRLDDIREDLEWAPDRLADVLDGLSSLRELTWEDVEQSLDFRVRGRDWRQNPSVKDLPTVVEILAGGDRFVTVFKNSNLRTMSYDRPAEINWAAIGAVDIETTMKMVTQLYLAAQVARLMDRTDYDEVK